VDKILLDSDVILDFFLDRKPFSEDAAIILTRCELKEIQGYVTPEK
jgi:predicted nucleic acid-binding protein